MEKKKRLKSYDPQRRSERLVQLGIEAHQKGNQNEGVADREFPGSQSSTIYDFVDESCKSPVHDSDKDPEYDPSISDLDQVSATTSSCSSHCSEQSRIVPFQEALVVSVPDTSNAKENVQNWSNENTNLTNEVDNVPVVIPKMWKKKKTFCKFCKLEVTNFERHLERNHKDYKEVVEILSYPKKGKKRKEIIGVLRKAGQFEDFLKGNVRPVYETNRGTSQSYYPCINCKGLYRRHSLCRHQKKCKAVAVTNDSKRIKHLSASQTLIACALQGNSSTLDKLRVKEEVFSLMKPDEISLVAKSDPLIYHFGEQYLKKHCRKQMAVVCSNKMRELARLLIELRLVKMNENYTLVDALEPAMFDTVIACAKKIGGYERDTKTYRAPSLSAHIGTSLKQVSDILIRLILKQDPSVICSDPEIKMKQIKRFRDLISSQWTTEISSLAFKNLQEKKWNKPTILPLTKDILKFRDYVVQIANKAVAVLKENCNDKKIFRNLVDATLTLTILYNRKRIGDVQYTLLQSYLNNISSVNQEECLNSLSASEKVLAKYYKRVVTGGKGSKPVVILFPQNIQEYMNIMIEIRQNTNLVPSNNVYLFAYSDSDRWARGDVAIRKFSEKAHLDYPKAITSNKLRKQIATVMQILNLNQEETEQFAQFMGHTEKTHNEYYRLPQDVYQTAKISKLLILMDKGSGYKYKGKALSEIDINPEVDLAESDDCEEEGALEVHPIASGSNYICESPKPSTSNSDNPSTTTGRSAWTTEQSEVVKKHFRNHIEHKKAPKKHECVELIQKHPHLLNNKDWVRVKTYVYNQYRIK